MKLWIRSQDRTELSECDSIHLMESNPANKKKTTYGIIANCSCVGVYPTRERCLEIIDEIQKLLEMADPTKAFLNIECDGLLDYDEVKEIIKMARTEKVGYVPNGKVELIMPNVITYQMPEK